MNNGNSGVTPSEQYLSKICKTSFLSLWSYSNPFTDRGANSQNPQGKELCDLLVVFDRDVIIFSDKSCDVPSSGNVQRDWNRWYKRAIEKSADQIYGAERWINTHPNRIYLDKKCTVQFPLAFAETKNIRFHRVVVALGAGRRVEEYYGGGSSGSLMLYPSIIGEQHYSADPPFGPFRVGQPNPNNGFIHIFDDVTLSIVLSELNTIYDFVKYLLEKEEFLLSPRVALCHGEEELLSFYLQNALSNGSPTFSPPYLPKLNEHALVLSEGLWDDFTNSEFYQYQKQIQEQSYLIDKLIESVSTHIIDGTLAYGSSFSFESHEQNIRFLASEPRAVRAIFGHAILQKIATTPSNVRTGLVLNSEYSDRRFIFLLVSRSANQTQHAFRIARQNMLQAYAYVVKALNPTVRYVYGIVTEAGRNKLRRSEDFMSFDFDGWSDEDQILAMRIKSEDQILDETSPRTIFDPPNIARYSSEAGNSKERRKNNAVKRRSTKRE